MLDIDRPVAVFDLEATGTDPETARIIEIGIMRLVPEGEEAEEEISDGVYKGKTYNQLVNPRMPIPEEVTEITGIEDEDVVGMPSFSEIAFEVAGLIEDADLAGFNLLSYDIPLLKKEFVRDGRPEELVGPDDRKVLDMLKLEKALQSRSLEALYQKYSGGEEPEDAHRALSDAKATVSVLYGQLGKYEPKDCTPTGLQEKAKGDYLDFDRKLRVTNPDNINMDTVVIQFGKHEGKSVAWAWENDRGYVEWMIEEIDEITKELNSLIHTDYYESDGQPNEEEKAPAEQ